MDKLPTELLLLISSYLERPQRISLRLVNRSFRHALGREVWTKLRFHGSQTPNKLKGWTSISSIPDFNKSLSRSPQEALLVREVLVEGDCTDMMVQFEKFKHLLELYLTVTENNRLPLVDILAKTTHAKRHVKYSGKYVGEKFAGQSVSGLEMDIDNNPLPGCVCGLWGTPYLPDSLDDFSVTGGLVHYAEVLAKSWSECISLEKLAVNVPLYNPFGYNWVPDTVTTLTIGDCGDIPFGDASRPAILRNVKNLVAKDPSKSLRMVQLGPECKLSSLTLHSTGKFREVDDVDGQFYSNEEREIAQLAAQFMPVHTLTCINLTLSLTAVLCSSSVHRLVIEQPKTPAQTTFTNFNGMLTRLAHHQPQLLVPKCANIQYLSFDSYFDFIDEDRGVGFLTNLLKQCRQISTVALYGKEATLSRLVPYQECLRQMPESEHAGTEWQLDIAQFRRKYSDI